MHILHNDPSRSSKVIDFGTNRKRLYDFLFGLNSNLGPLLPVSEILELLYAESRFFQHPTPIRAKISGVPLEQTRHVGVAKSEHPRLTNGEIIFEEF